MAIGRNAITLAFCMSAFTACSTPLQPRPLSQAQTTSSAVDSGAPQANARKKASETGVWSINMYSQAFLPADSNEARDDFGRRLKILADIMNTRRGQGWTTDLVVMQESSVGGDHSITCFNGERIYAAQCLAAHLQAQTGRAFGSLSSGHLALVYDATVYETLDRPIYVIGTTPGYEKLKNGQFYGNRIRHKSTGLSFWIVSVHLAVTGGYHHRIDTNNWDPEYHLDGLYLLESFVRKHHVQGDGMAIVAGDFNHSFSSDKDNRVPFAVFDPEAPDMDSIDLGLLGPRTLAGTSSSYYILPATNKIKYFTADDYPPGSCAAWSGVFWQEGRGFSDHCAMASIWNLWKQEGGSDPPACDPAVDCCPPREICSCNNVCALPSKCDALCP